MIIYIDVVELILVQYNINQFPFPIIFDSISKK